MDGEPVRATTVGDILQDLLPRLHQQARLADVLAWPPDVFAVCSRLLQLTGAYVRVVDLLNQTIERDADTWPEAARGVAAAWTRAVCLRTTAPVDVPAEVSGWWHGVQQARDVALSEVRQDDRLTRCLLCLTCVADEASSGAGVGRVRRRSGVPDRVAKGREGGSPDSALTAATAAEDLAKDRFVRLADDALARHDFHTLCREVPFDRLSVLPKQHAPQRGLTLRSLSHHLAMSAEPELNSRWIGYDHSVRANLNVLVVPWPLQIPTTAFRVRPHQGLPEKFRYFEFSREGDPELGKRMARYLSAAQAHADRIDFVVLPELSLTPDEYAQVEHVCLEHGVVLIAGVAEPEGPQGGPFNASVVQPAARYHPRHPMAWRDRARVTQHKHHRWCLDAWQIPQYGLSGVLPSSRDCWEHIDISQGRTLNFHRFSPWLTLCVLLCEDLARQDPVAGVVRAVGPNLVVALLMDGPQLEGRWGSRYATVLAEDPGCSVLSVTSLGMVTRSRPLRGGVDRSRVVGLFRDVYTGSHELQLDEGAEAGLLSLVTRAGTEFTADGREDGGTASFPVFSGFRSLTIDAEGR